MKTKNIRAVCAEMILNVVENGQSLSVVLNDLKQVKERDRPLVQELTYGILRTLPELEFYVQQLMARVLVNKNRIVHALILVGLYQLCHTRIPAHAALSETVEATVVLNKQGFKKVVNGVLRSFLRQKTQLEQAFKNSDLASLHPKWLLEEIQKAYPKDWQSIIHENNQRPPMWIRLNETQCTRADYLALLDEAGIQYSENAPLSCAIQLTAPVAVAQLPLFDQGAITVQDLSAQQAAFLVQPQKNELILDLCAAPGGKTTHLLEQEPSIALTAVDIDAKRVARVKENLTRLNQNAKVIIGDGLAPETWADNQQFDKILLDAPCSAIGVIRRHPDIKWLRKKTDIEALTKTQQQMLEKIWPYLKPNGTLVYATCSILPQENQQQIDTFLKNHSEAVLQKPMQTILPLEGDGFFYAVLKKSESICA